MYTEEINRLSSNEDARVKLDAFFYSPSIGLECIYTQMNNNNIQRRNRVRKKREKEREVKILIFTLGYELTQKRYSSGHRSSTSLSFYLR